MNYQKIYQNIINNAQKRIPDDNVYYENHHIIPKCMGGTNEDINIVKLTYREHFVSHWLLHNIYPENRQLHCAFNFMAYGKWSVKTYDTIISSRILEERKIKLVKTFSSNEHKQKVKDGWSKSSRKLSNRVKNTIVEDIREKELDDYLNFIKNNDSLIYEYYTNDII